MHTSQRQFSNKNLFAFSLFQYLCSLLADFVTRIHIVMDLGLVCILQICEKKQRKSGCGGVRLGSGSDAESKSA